MPCPKGIIFALLTLRKARKSAPLAVGGKAFAPACKELMWIGLVSYIKDQYILRSVEHIVQGNSQLYHAQACSQVAFLSRYFIDNKIAQLPRKLLKLCEREIANIFVRVKSFFYYRELK